MASTNIELDGVLPKFQLPPRGARAKAIKHTAFVDYEDPTALHPSDTIQTCNSNEVNAHIDPTVASQLTELGFPLLTNAQSKALRAFDFHASVLIEGTTRAAGKSSIACIAIGNAVKKAVDEDDSVKDPDAPYAICVYEAHEAAQYSYQFFQAMLPDLEVGLYHGSLDDGHNNIPTPGHILCATPGKLMAAARHNDHPLDVKNLRFILIDNANKVLGRDFHAHMDAGLYTLVNRANAGRPDQKQRQVRSVVVSNEKLSRTQISTIQSKLNCNNAYRRFQFLEQEDLPVINNKYNFVAVTDDSSRIDWLSSYLGDWLKERKGKTLLIFVQTVQECEWLKGVLQFNFQSKVNAIFADSFVAQLSSGVAVGKQEGNQGRLVRGEAGYFHFNAHNGTVRILVATPLAQNLEFPLTPDILIFHTAAEDFSRKFSAFEIWRAQQSRTGRFGAKGTVTTFLTMNNSRDKGLAQSIKNFLSGYKHELPQVIDDIASSTVQPQIIQSNGRGNHRRRPRGDGNGTSRGHQNRARGGHGDPSNGSEGDNNTGATRQNRDQGRRGRGRDRGRGRGGGQAGTRSHGGSLVDDGDQNRPSSNTGDSQAIEPASDAQYTVVSSIADNRPENVRQQIENTMDAARESTKYSDEESSEMNRKHAAELLGVFTTLTLNGPVKSAPTPIRQPDQTQNGLEPYKAPLLDPWKKPVARPIFTPPQLLDTQNRPKGGKDNSKQIMSSMGYKEGQGLGRDNDDIVDPVKAEGWFAKVGVGYGGEPYNGKPPYPGPIFEASSQAAVADHNNAGTSSQAPVEEEDGAGTESDSSDDVEIIVPPSSPSKWNSRPAARQDVHIEPLEVTFADNTPVENTSYRQMNSFTANMTSKSVNFSDGCTPRKTAIAVPGAYPVEEKGPQLANAAPTAVSGAEGGVAGDGGGDGDGDEVIGGDEREDGGDSEGDGRGGRFSKLLGRITFGSKLLCTCM